MQIETNADLARLGFQLNGQPFGQVITREPRVAIMQGRLLPPEDGRFQYFPVGRWREEFIKAAEVGVDAIEWIYDWQSASVNPLVSAAGIAEMQALSREHNIAVVSLCADYFLDRPFVAAGRADFAGLTTHLIWLLDRCRLAGISRVVLPFVDASRLESPAQRAAVAEMLDTVLPHAAAASVEVHLETALCPGEFAALLARLPHPFLKANYDSGNSASLGYDVALEIAAYGPRIGSVHIKDRLLGGGTVPLGTGDANLPALLAGLRAQSYSGDFVLQVARGPSGEEVEWGRRNVDYFRREWARSATASSAAFVTSKVSS